MPDIEIHGIPDAYREDDGSYSHYAPIIGMEGESLPLYAACIPTPFPECPEIPVPTKRWFLGTFLDCFSCEREASADEVLGHACQVLSIYRVKSASSSFRDYMEFCFQRAGLYADEPTPQEDIKGLLQALERIVHLADCATGICRWHGRPNAQRIGPKFMPMVHGVIDIDELNQ